VIRDTWQRGGPHAHIFSTRRAQTQGQELTTSTRFAFTKVHVTNLSKQTAFYCSVFGLTEKARLTVGTGADAFEEVILKTGRSDDSALVLLRYLKRDNPAPEGLILGFNVPDLHATVRQVTKHGGFIAEPAKEMAEHGVLVAFAKDPEGHLIEIVQNV